MAGEFDKDFGYLIPFIDKIAAAAAKLSDPESRAELSRLVADEKEKWSRIRQLLLGEPDPEAAREIVESGTEGVPPQFTVGSLRNR